MKNRHRSYSDQMITLYKDPNDWTTDWLPLCRNITIQVTEACNLACTYCYQKHKSPKRMSWETGKRIVDFLFEEYDKNDPNQFINHSTKALILDFIGGEPLLEVELMDKIVDYFWKTALMRGHIWASNFRISISSNGTLYFEPEVQKFLSKYKDKTSFSISIDGPQEMHDACRVYHDGRGSWADANAAQVDYHSRYPQYNLETKMTLAKENLHLLHSTFKYFVENGYKTIFGNPIFERDWTPEDGKVYYEQLCQVADYMIENNLVDEIDTTFFDDRLFIPKEPTDLGTYCGGAGSMLAFDPDGRAFPCLRYMESSLNGEQEPLVIGDCWSGIYNTPKTISIYDMLKAIDRRTSNDDECFNCPIATGCANCIAWDYQKWGTPDKKSKGICWMHRARCLANAYFWNKAKGKGTFHINLPDDLAIQIVGEEELERLKQMQ